VTPTSLGGQSAIVTGGARGIGLAIARRLAREGCRIVLWDRDPGAFDAQAAGFMPEAIEAVDVADYAAVARTHAATLARVGSVQVLVNNAGITKAKIPMGRLLLAEEVAAMVAWISSPECSFTTGVAFDLSGGRADD